MSKAAQLFGEDLRLKRLNKMWKKNKNDVVDTIDVCGWELLDYFYNEIFNKSEREYRQSFDNLVTAPVFLKALKKVVSKKNDSEYSKEGFAFVLTNALDNAKHQLNDEIKRIKDSNMTVKDKENSIKYVEEQYEKLTVLIGKICDTVTTRTVKKLRKMGMQKEYARYLASGLITSEWANEKNVFRYMRFVWKCMYRVQELGVEYSDDKKSYTSKIGLALEDPKNIAKIMKSVCLKEANKDMLMNVVINAALDQKDRFYTQNLTGAQQACYNAITYYILELMNSSIFDKNDRMKIFKDIARKRIDSRKGGYDSERRIMFSKVKDMVDSDGRPLFPKVVKAWDKYSDNLEN